MRLLYLADAPYPHTWRWVEHFAAAGHDCEVISFRPAEIAGARVTYVDGFERLGKARYLIHARRVGRLIRERRPDILHALHLTSYGFLGALSGFHPFVVSAWGTDILDAPTWSPFHSWLTRLTLRRADRITATGDHLAAATAAYTPPGARVDVVPYGVDLERFQPASRESHAGPTVIGTVARLSLEKGVIHLVEAFALLARRYPGRVRLRIAGDGPEGAQIRARIRALGIEADVEVCGWVDYGDIPAFLRALDIFVLPSIFEGFGVAAAEASAMALPVVASRVHGIPDVVVDGETGMLVPARDNVALAGAIAHLVEDASLRRSMGAAGREFVQRRYDWQDNAATMARIYGDMLARRGARVTVR
jgi:glycosyltransferase involved in cell wall biosynthesis